MIVLKTPFILISGLKQAAAEVFVAREQPEFISMQLEGRPLASASALRLCAGSFMALWRWPSTHSVCGYSVSEIMASSCNAKNT